jgi:hypothetical protein
MTPDARGRGEAVPQDDIAAVIGAISALVTGKAGVVETCDERFLNRIIFSGSGAVRSHMLESRMKKTRKSNV